MKNKSVIGGILVAVLLVGAWLLLRPATGDNAPKEGTTHTDHAEEYYTCPMHPSVRSDRPGACPVCGMALVRKSAMAAVSDSEIADLRMVSLSPAQRVVANVSTVPVVRRNLETEIRTVGVVDYAEPNFRHISMRFPGRLEKLHINYTGQTVRKGDPVAEVYSPDAVSAQQEYLLALESYERMKNGRESVAREMEQLLENARRKLLLWDFTERQVEELKKTRKIRYYVTIVSPISGTVLAKNADEQHYAMTGEDIFDIADLSRVWVYLEVYEKDLRFVIEGQQVQITSEAYPGESFVGRVTFIEPVLNPESRTVRVRTEFPNPKGKLKPNMYVNARIVKSIRDALVVPRTAIMSTGKRNVVWIEVGENNFEPRDVVVGTTNDAYVQILEGLRVGELVAATGGFLIDSESALQLPGGTDQHAGHSVQAATTSEGEAKSVSGDVHIRVKGKYMPEVIHLRKGEKARLHFYRDEDIACTDEVIFDGLDIRRKLPAFATTTVEFTPSEAGEFSFTCGMRMVHGKIVVR